MLHTTIRAPPSPGSFTTLEEYQSATPESFVDGKPILHLHLQGVTARVPRSGVSKLGSAFTAITAQSDPANGDAEAVIEQEVDVFVSSETFTLYSHQAEAGNSIPYPSISIHALKNVETKGGPTPSTTAFWMLLDFSDPYDDEDSTVPVTLIPRPSGDPAVSSTQRLFEAVTECSNLHPDPYGEDEDEEGGGGGYDDDRIIFEGSAEHEALEGFSGVLRGASDGSLPPPMPGSSGWITAENVNEYFDADGNWIADDKEEEEEEEGGESAERNGRIRSHSKVNGGDVDEEMQGLAKRPRVDEPSGGS